jgi:hypothetical protein
MIDLTPSGRAAACSQAIRAMWRSYGEVVGKEWSVLGFVSGSNEESHPGEDKYPKGGTATRRLDLQGE